jgi:benzoate-CoA ligase family protein
VTDWPSDLSVYRYFLADRLEEGMGDRVALRLEGGNMTYLEVDSLAARYASRLQGLGVAKGDRVLIMLPDGADFVGALFGVFRLGAVVVMLNPGLTGEAIKAIVDSSRAAAAVVHLDHFDSFVGAVRESGPDVLTVGPGLDPGPGTVDVAATGPEDIAIWLFSGGTTGAPKAVEQTHRSLVNTTRLYGQGILGLTPDDITISVPKLYFGYATGSNLLFPFSVGASSVLFRAHPTPGALFELIAAHRPTVLVNVPSAINQMVNDPRAVDADLSSLRLTTSAGEALPESLHRRWIDTIGVELLDGLGTAEMWHIFISNRPGQVKAGTLGQVVPGFEIKVCDDHGAQLPVGEVGRLWVKGDSLGRGYWEDPERTAEAFRPPWFVGGDLVSIDEEGYVTHRGRSDDAIKVKGKWFRPQELESVLLEHPAVAQCAVVAIDDDSGLARPVAFVVPSGEIDEAGLIEFSVARLEPYKRPRKVYFIDRLPQTHLGKVDRAALRRSAV